MGTFLYCNDGFGGDYLLWEEYSAAHPGAYSYSRFCKLYREFEYQGDAGSAALPTAVATAPWGAARPKGPANSFLNYLILRIFLSVRIRQKYKLLRSPSTEGPSSGLARARCRC
jgi:hypothetical protein